MAAHYLCSFCKTFLKQPVQSTNGHLFCKECFYNKNPALSCQLCEEDGISRTSDCFRLGAEKFFPDKAVVHDINKLEASCRTCGLVDSYFEIMQNHMRRPCQMPILSRTVSTWT